MGTLEKRISKINGHIVVAKNFGLGTYIQINGLTQSGGIVERIWKQTLKKTYSLLRINNKTLILGLGGGSAAKVIQKLWPKVEITGVELDPLMIELGKKYLKLNLKKIYIGDGVKAVQRTKVNYDLILIDTYLGDKFPEKFEELSFLRNVTKRLNKEGIAIFNRLYFGDKRKEAVKFGEKLKKVFSEVSYFYPEANLMFICKA